MVKVVVGENALTAIVIDTPESAPYLVEGSEIKVLFKETEVSIGLSQEHQISMQNQLPGTVKALDTGELLSKVVIQIDTTAITSIITSNAVRQLQIRPDLPVVALIKTNEIMLAD